MDDLFSKITWQNKASRDNDLTFVKKPKKAADAILVAESTDALAPLEVKVKPGESARQTRAKQKTTQFVELVRGGLAPEDAAERIGLKIDEVARITDGADAKRIIGEVIQAGYMRSDVRKEFSRALTNVTVMEAHLEGDRRGVYDGLKIINADPEIGLTGPSTVNAIQVNFTDLQSVIGEFLEDSSQKAPESVDSITIPVLPSESQPAAPQTTPETEEN